jgi:ssRNA-specific RNase YbeY (16S rRNA maturation enzyme)
LPKRASSNGDLRGSQSTSHSRSRGGAAILTAAALVLAAAGMGAHAAPVVLAEAPRLGMPMPPAPTSATAPPQTSATASPSTIGEPEPTVAPAPGAQQRPKAGRPAAKPKVPSSGPGTYVSAKINGKPAGSGTVVNFHVRREKNVPVDVEAAARTIQSVLNDPRSWRAGRTWEFQLVSSADRADAHVFITTPATTDRLCAPLLTRGEVSCQNGDRVVLNAKRWVFGAETYGTDLTNYRRYLVNHEFGHVLGYQHTQCSGKGKKAGIMVQQTKGLDGCRANPWPYPKG